MDRPKTDSYSAYNRDDLHPIKVHIECLMQANTRKLIYDPKNKIHYEAEPFFFRIPVIITELELDSRNKARLCTIQVADRLNNDALVRLPVCGCAFEDGAQETPEELAPYLDDAF